MTERTGRLIRQQRAIESLKSADSKNLSGQALSVAYNDIRNEVADSLSGNLKEEFERQFPILDPVGGTKVGFGRYDPMQDHNDRNIALTKLIQMHGWIAGQVEFEKMIGESEL